MQEPAARGEAPSPRQSRTNNHKHKERGGGRREAEPWQAPEQRARQPGERAVGAHEHPTALLPPRKGSAMVQGVSSLPPHPRSPPSPRTSA